MDEHHQLNVNQQYPPNVNHNQQHVVVVTQQYHQPNVNNIINLMSINNIINL